MPVLVHCPQCNSGLQVPDDFIGKQVRCSQCQNVFAVAGTAPPPAQPPAPPMPPPVPPPQSIQPSAPQPHVPPQPGAEGYGVTQPPAPPAPPRRRRRDDDYDDDYDEYDEPRRPRKKKRKKKKKHISQSDAQAHVQIPGTLIHISAVIAIVLQILGLIRAIFEAVSMSVNQDPALLRSGVDPSTILFTQVGISLLFCVWCGVLIAGANHLKCLDGYTFSLATCVMAVVPCYCCSPIGMIGGIWGFIVLMMPEVRSHFR